MEQITDLIILFAIGNIAGFINVMAGGGSTLTLPVLIFMGLDPATANGTNRIGILLQNATAIKSFNDQNFSDFKLSFKLAVLTLPGGIIGALFAVRIEGDLFRIMLGIVLIYIVITMLIPRKEIKEENGNGKVSFTTYLAMIGIGFYGGFIQVGVGFILMSALHYLMKLTLVHVNMHKVFIVFIYTIPALSVFIFTGNVNWTYGLALAAGTSLGAWWSVKVAVKGGDKIVRYILIVAILIISSKLLGVY